MIGPFVLVTGGRKYANRAALFAKLDELAPYEICFGDATGADALAKEWAQLRGVTYREYFADWVHLKRKAGSVRNGWMVTGFFPDIVVACPGGRGTADCMRRARRARIRVEDVEPIQQSMGWA